MALGTLLLAATSLNDGIADSVHNAHSRVGLLFGDRDGGISSDVLGHLNSLGNDDALVGGVQDVRWPAGWSAWPGVASAKAETAHRAASATAQSMARNFFIWVGLLSIAFVYFAVRFHDY